MENKNCDYCNSCDYCNYCNFCNYCDYCYFCYFCSSCYSCINLKMTEYNYFCYAEDIEKDGFQQKRYRIFNQQLTEEEYSKIVRVSIELEFDENENYETRYKTAFKNAWNKLKQEDKYKIINLPGFNAEDFKKYYGVEIKKEELTQEELIQEEIKKLRALIK